MKAWWHLNIFNSCQNSLPLETVYSEVLNGDNSFAKYFARWYVAVLRLEIIGRIGNFSIPVFLITFNFFTFTYY